MLLLNRKKITEDKRKEDDIRVHDKAKMDKVISDTYKELVDVRLKKTQKIEEINKSLRSAEVEFGTRIHELKNEVLSLEDRKIAAMKPVKAERDELRLEQAEFAMKLAEHDDAETCLIVRAEELTDKLNQLIIDREEVIEHKAHNLKQKIEAKELGADAVSKIKKAAEAILKVDEREEQFQKNYKMGLKEFKKQKTSAHALIEIADRKEEALEKRENKLIRDKKSLELVFDEARKKGLL